MVMVAGQVEVYSVLLLPERTKILTASWNSIRMPFEQL
jgi:hypothetical protein